MKFTSMIFSVVKNSRKRVLFSLFILVFADDINKYSYTFLCLIIFSSVVYICIFYYTYIAAKRSEREKSVNFALLCII